MEITYIVLLFFFFSSGSNRIGEVERAHAIQRCARIWRVYIVYWMGKHEMHATSHKHTQFGLLFYCCVHNQRRKKKQKMSMKIVHWLTLFQLSASKHCADWTTSDYEILV